MQPPAQNLAPAGNDPVLGRLVATGRLQVAAGALFGRDNDLAALDQCWEDGAHLVTIAGWEGIGKTALLNTWLARVRDEGWRGAQRVFGWSFPDPGADRQASSDDFMARALRWFGDPEPSRGTPWNKGERLAELVRRYRTLLVLDGLESMQWRSGPEEGRLRDPALRALLKGLAAKNGGLCLITARMTVADLEAGDKLPVIPLEPMSPEAGASLLLAHGVQGPDTELQDATTEYAGHSLSLTLLGSYLKKAQRGEVRRRAVVRPAPQEDGTEPRLRRLLAAHEQTLRKRRAELGILRLLVLFGRPATVEELSALGKRPLIRGLTDLLEVEDTRFYHLFTRWFTAVPSHPMNEQEWATATFHLRELGLSSSDGDRRHALHPLVRGHFEEQLRKAEPEALREGHRRLYVYFQRKAPPLPQTVEQAAPLYEAVAHGCLAGFGQEALDEVWWKRLRRTNEAYSIKRLGAFSSEVALFSAFFDPPWERLAPGLNDTDQEMVLNEAGAVLREQGRLSEAAGLLRLCMAQDIQRKDWSGAAISGTDLSALHLARGELREAEAVARKSAQLAEQSGDAGVRMLAWTARAAALHALGGADEALALFEEAERIQKRRQPTSPLLHSVQGFHYCDLLLARGREGDVLERAERTLMDAKSRHAHLDFALDNLSLGRAHLNAKRKRHAQTAEREAGQAAFYLEHAVEGLRRAGRQDFLCAALLAEVDLHLFTGDHEPARRALEEAHSVSTRNGFCLHEADVYMAYVRLALASSELFSAATYLSKARALIKASAYQRRERELADLERDYAVGHLRGGA